MDGKEMEGEEERTRIVGERAKRRREEILRDMRERVRKLRERRKKEKRRTDWG